MALYAMSDLHLSLTVQKPMDIFGPAWHNYMDKIKSGWNKTVSSDDTVIVGGDISWGMYLDEAMEDFRLLNSLPGKKVLLRGNHDYWWESLTKLKAFAKDNGFDTLEFLQNDSFCADGFAICGTRGWLTPHNDGFGSKDRKIYERELIRLSLSIENGKKRFPDCSMIAVLHFPPVRPDGCVDEGICKILKSFDVRKCLYGHLHGQVAQNAFEGISEGIDFRLTSADYLNFIPCNLD